MIGLMTASNATGQLVFLPLLAALTEAYGWRTALTLSVAVIATAMILVLLLMRDHPSDVGLPAYGETAVSKPPKQDHNLRYAGVTAGDAEKRVRQPGFLGSVRHILRLRAVHQWPDPDPLDFDLR